MSTCLGIRGDIDSYNLNACICSSTQPTTHEIAPNSAKSIYRNTQGHIKSGQTAGFLAADHTDMGIKNRFFYPRFPKNKSQSPTKLRLWLEKLWRTSDNKKSALSFKPLDKPLANLLNQYGHIHFIGVGGIGMSALAAILVERGYSISGSDQKNSLTLKKYHHPY